MNFSNVKVGDRILISKPSSNAGLAAISGFAATVLAVRPKSFDAAGLCFRMDGREWRGNRWANPMAAKDRRNAANPLAGDGEAELAPGEEAILASMLSTRSETEWLNLGVDELRRIAEQFNDQPMKKTG
jgi:hypothetical protein